MSESSPDPDDNPMLHPGGCPCPRCEFEPDPAPTLDFDAFTGHTPGPWAARRLGPPSYAVEVCYRNGWPLLTGAKPERPPRLTAHDTRAFADATLAAAAPALLAECRRLRAELENERSDARHLYGTFSECQDRANCQRAEIERLRAVVKSLAGCDPYPDDAGHAENTLNGLIEAARAAIAERGI